MTTTPSLATPTTDLRDRWKPTDRQMAVAAAILAADPDIDVVFVALALPGKQPSWWQVGQPVEPVAGYWPAITGGLPDHPGESWSDAREAADQAAGRHLNGRPGMSSYAIIGRDAALGTTFAVWEGIYGTRS